MATQAGALHASLPRPLPALRHDAHGRHRIDYRAVFALAAPLFLNSGIQAVLNLTDTWFIGHISTTATAGVGAVYWFVIVFILVFGGVSMAVQTLVAQAYGAGARHEAAQKASVDVSKIEIDFGALGGGGKK